MTPSGVCKYCGKTTAFFLQEHSECRQKRDDAWAEMLALIEKAAAAECEPQDILSRLNDLAQAHVILPSEIKEILIQGWEKAAGSLLKDRLLTEGEEERLMAMKRIFDLSQDDLDRQGTFTNLVKAGCLRDVLNGKIPDRITLQGQLPFNFLKNEKLIWIFKQVNYLVDNETTEYKGLTIGGGIEIAKGLFFTLGSFRGKPILKNQRIRVDTGYLAATNQHVYFHGHRKSFRIPYPKIISFVPYSDGIGLYKEAENPSQQIFATGDGWFTYNLIVNLARLYAK